MRRRSSEEKKHNIIDFDNKRSKMKRRLKQPRKKSRRSGRSEKQKQSLKRRTGLQREVQRGPCQWIQRLQIR